MTSRATLANVSGYRDRSVHRRRRAGRLILVAADVDPIGMNRPLNLGLLVLGPLLGLLPLLLCGLLGRVVDVGTFLLTNQTGRSIAS